MKEMTADEKYLYLKEILKGYGSVAVAYSGGVDSTFLLTAAVEALGEKAAAVTAVSGTFPERERREAEAFCRERSIRLLTVRTNEMENENYRQNPPDRCYHCKKMIFRALMDTAAAEGLQFVAEGSNLDDEGDYRPGLKAIRELGIESPLRKAGLTKAEIRAISEKLGLPTWNKPSYACLATRIPCGEPITEEKLRRIGQAEQVLFDLGFAGMRVRDHGTVARIEVPAEQLSRIVSEEIRGTVAARFKELGYRYTAVDLEGYRMGSMNLQT